MPQEVHDILASMIEQQPVCVSPSVQFAEPESVCTKMHDPNEADEVVAIRLQKPPNPAYALHFRTSISHFYFQAMWLASPLTCWSS
jgi:hypothetical protein